VSTPRYLDLPDQVRSVTIQSHRGPFAALEAQPARGVCERRPALLVPGFTGSKEDFIPVLQPLASAGRRVIAIDMRGQYQSQGPVDPGGYAPSELAADVAAVADASAHDAQGVHLLGHSLGGLIAREAALARATPILSLTLLSSGPASLAGERAELLRGMLAALEAAGSAPGQLRATVGKLWDDHLEPEARADGVPEQIIAFLHTRMLANSPTGLMVMGRYLLGCPDRTAELANLGGPPILVLYGENDDAWPPAVQDRMARRLGAQRVCIPGAGHSPAVEAPETTASTLTAFWRAAEDSHRRRHINRPAGRRHSGPAAPAAASGPAAPGRPTSSASASGASASGSAALGSAVPDAAASAGAPGAAASPAPSPSHGRRGPEACIPSGQWAR
jgi:pimeloyl-ACP methyl ester carboxylesterase